MSRGSETLRAVLFDVDFTLARPGPELGPEGYVRAGARHGLTLDPSRYEAARDAALVDLHRHPELEHDDEIWFRFTERIIRGMGGDADSAYDCAVEITRAWERHENFELYDDVAETLGAIRAAGLRIGLISNSARDVREFALHHALDVDAGISSFHHGRTKPHASIFRAVLDLVAALGGPLWIAAIVFGVGSFAALGLLRPIVRVHLRMPHELRTGVAALEGAKAVVLQRVDGMGGRVKIGGEEWSARSYMPDEAFDPGTQVEVVQIEGATALVYK